MKGRNKALRQKGRTDTKQNKEQLNKEGSRKEEDIIPFKHKHESVMVLKLDRCDVFQGQGLMVFSLEG